VRVPAVLLLAALSLNAQTFIQRLSAPVSLEFGLQPAWQANPLNLSALEMDRLAADSGYLGGIQTTDSRVITGLAKWRYAPRLWEGRKTAFYSSLFYHLYLDIEERTYLSFTLSVRQSFGRWRFLEMGYGVLPSLYLRHYFYNLDPGIQPGRYACDFGTDRIWLEFEKRLTPKLWLGSRVTGRTERYSAPFSHYDMRKLEGLVSVDWRPRGDWRTGLEASYGHSANQNMADDHDRSFHYLDVDGSLRIPLGKPFAALELDGAVEQRAYLSDDQLDELHSGRYHIEYRLESRLWLPEGERFSWYPYAGYRHRAVESDSDLVRDLKSFTRWWVGVRVSFTSIIDIYL